MVWRPTRSASRASGASSTASAAGEDTPPTSLGQWCSSPDPKADAPGLRCCSRGAVEPRRRRPPWAGHTPRPALGPAPPGRCRSVPSLGATTGGRSSPCCALARSNWVAGRSGGSRRGGSFGPRCRPGRPAGLPPRGLLSTVRHHGAVPNPNGMLCVSGRCPLAWGGSSALFGPVGPPRRDGPHPPDEWRVSAAEAAVSGLVRGRPVHVDLVDESDSSGLADADGHGVCPALATVAVVVVSLDHGVVAPSLAGRCV